MKILRIMSIFILIIGCANLENIDNSNKLLKRKLTKYKKIPFIMRNGLIIIKAKINESEKKVNFIFDTGASVSVLNSNYIDDFDVKKSWIKKWMTDSSGKGRFLSRCKINRLAFGELRFKDVKAVETNLNTFEDYTGVNIHGIIGANIIRKYVVTINYDKKYIIFSTKKYHKPKKGEELIELKLKNLYFSEFIPEIKGMIYGNKEISFRIDTGSSGIISIPRDYVGIIKKEAKKNVKKIRGISAQGIWGEVKDSYIIKLENIRMNNLRIDSMILKVTDYPIALLGNGFLENFVVELNYPKNKLLLYPKEKLENYGFKTYGLGLFPKKDKIIVYSIIEDTSADISDIEIGDEVLELNYKDINKLSVEQIASILTNKKVEKLTVKYKRGMEIKEVILEKQKIID